MNGPTTPRSSAHYMPYVVAAVIVGVAIVGTRYISGKATATPPPKSDTHEREPKVTPPPSEPVLGYELPGRSYIGTIGKEKGLKATIFGRESDLLKVVNSKSSGLTLDVASGDPFAAMKPSDSSLPSTVSPGHVLIVMANLKQFLKLVAETRKSTPDGSASPDIGRLTVNSQGAVEVVIGVSDGVVIDATPFDKLEMSFPNGGLRLNTPN